VVFPQGLGGNSQGLVGLKGFDNPSIVPEAHDHPGDVSQKRLRPELEHLKPLEAPHSLLVLQMSAGFQLHVGPRGLPGHGIYSTFANGGGGGGEKV